MFLFDLLFFVGSWSHNRGGRVEWAKCSSNYFSLVHFFPLQPRDRVPVATTFPTNFHTNKKLEVLEPSTTSPILAISKMASSQSRGGERMIHQDFIARIRYSNALPPPPVPPKLLDLPNTGLSSGQYTTPGFASRLAREQPLNIEADAELGMPLDLVGMPGIFDGDESCMLALPWSSAIASLEREKAC